MGLAEQNRLATFRLQKVFTISIVLFLGVLSFISFDYIRSKVRDQKRKADIRQVVQGLQLYYEKHGVYPEVEDEDFSGFDSSFEPAGNIASFLDILYEEEIMDFVPVDPRNSDIYNYRYIKYPSGSYGCQNSFFLLQVTNFEQKEDDKGAGSCPEADFVSWAENGYTIQMFE